MQKVAFNKHIDKVGIEFEGFFESDFASSLTDRGGLIHDVGTDGSLRSDDFSSNHNMHGFEARSFPLGVTKLNELLVFMSEAQKNKKYYINHSCGLHFHVSLKKHAYGSIVNKKFYDDFCNLMKTHFNKIYQDRYNNEYCSQDPSPSHVLDFSEGDKDRYDKEHHFRLQSRRKYRFINFAYRDHGTIEFRAYGGKYAIVEELSSCIAKTLDLLDSHISGRQPDIVSEKIMVDRREGTKCFIDLSKEFKPLKKGGNSIKIPTLTIKDLNSWMG